MTASFRRPIFLFLVLLAGAFPVAAADDAATAVVRTADGTEHSFTVELALTPAEQARGLMYRTELAPDAGMLFIFPDPKRASFWMQNTLIPLDMLFVRQNGRIANIIANAEPETTTSRRSTGRVKAVLEIPGGRAAELGIKAGDLVLHPMLGQGAAGQAGR